MIPFRSLVVHIDLSFRPSHPPNPQLQATTAAAAAAAAGTTTSVIS